MAEEIKNQGQQEYAENISGQAKYSFFYDLPRENR